MKKTIWQSILFSLIAHVLLAAVYLLPKEENYSYQDTYFLSASPAALLISIPLAAVFFGVIKWAYLRLKR
ncbi:hypothetical protein LRR81_11260 [Metabacillus sp. GX 13764]|uniref:hypothetical protein n=1 Tax=Metabacillus kandeliae TaxID=2900151 RepID=UPI001E2F3B5A|nr:hypothetical protein [Metabacillus kandeliae]MCD7034823.1 hypothetical protein [Metabacillus kandeliae]